MDAHEMIGRRVYAKFNQGNVIGSVKAITDDGRIEWFGVQPFIKTTVGELVSFIDRGPRIPPIGEE